LPLGPPARELSGDCRTDTSVLYTERQRLELHPEADWPFRVVGTQIGVAAYRQKHPTGKLQRRTDLEGGAIADERFKRFYQTYGGLPVFGYPISALLSEADAATGQSLTVQYFERARFELIPGAQQGAELLGQVRLGALGREYAGIAAQCGLPPTAVPASASQTQTEPPGGQAPSPSAEAAGGSRRWIWVALGLVGLLLVGAVAWEARRRQRIMQRRVARRQGLKRHNLRTREMRRPPSTPEHRRILDDDELLRQLLEGQENRT
jgi:hypothetical protein